MPGATAAARRLESSTERTTKTRSCSAPSSGSRAGSAPVARQQLEYASRRPSTSSTTRASSVQPGGMAVDDLDAVDRVERQLVLPGLAAQELLGERRPVVGRAVVVRDQADRGRPAGLPVAAGGGVPGRPAADDDDAFARAHRRSKRSSR